MKKITVRRRGNDITFVAPEDKEMVINEGALANGILAFGEYGPSGLKIATFKEWDEAIFDASDHGYTIDDTLPF